MLRQVGEREHAHVCRASGHQRAGDRLGTVAARRVVVRQDDDAAPGEVGGVLGAPLPGAASALELFCNHLLQDVLVEGEIGD